jgi:hypothetical protein
MTKDRKEGSAKIGSHGRGWEVGLRRRVQVLGDGQRMKEKVRECKEYRSA